MSIQPERVIAISYTDEHSVSGNARVDFQLGREHHQIGCNSSTMSNVPIGTWVLVQTKPGKLARTKLVQIVEIVAKVESSLWYDRQGQQWKHNYDVRPLTEVIEITDEVKQLWSQWCAESDLLYGVLLSRCNIEYLPVFQKIVSTYSCKQNE